MKSTYSWRNQRKKIWQFEENCFLRNEFSHELYLCARLLLVVAFQCVGITACSDEGTPICPRHLRSDRM